MWPFIFFHARLAWQNNEQTASPNKIDHGKLWIAEKLKTEDRTGNPFRQNVVQTKQARNFNSVKPREDYPPLRPSHCFYWNIRLQQQERFDNYTRKGTSHCFHSITHSCNSIITEKMVVSSRIKVRRSWIRALVTEFKCCNLISTYSPLMISQFRFCYSFSIAGNKNVDRKVEESSQQSVW